MLRPLVSWLTQPSSWIALVGVATSLAAAFVSGLTFYLVYADPGALQLVLPDRLGIKYVKRHDVVEMLVPLTFTNTGAPRTRRYVVRVTASLSPNAPPPPGTRNPTLEWEYELKFIGWREWLKKYPDFRERDRPPEDYVDYVGRAFAFPLAGGASDSKVLHMVQFEGSLSGRTIDDFTLVIVALEDRGRVEARRRYACPADVYSGQIFTWCRLVGPPA
jgi:hypothetical protein